MSERVTEVYLDRMGVPQLVGTAFFHGYGRNLRTTFTYASQWLADKGSYPLMPQAPLQQRSIQTVGLPGFLSDAAPDRWGRHLIFRGRQSLSVRNRSLLPSLDDVDYLLGVDDWSRMGALRFSTDGGQTFLGSGTDVPKLVRLPQLLDASVRVSAGADGWEQVKSLLDAGSSSLGGARPKATVSDDGMLLFAKFPSAHDEWSVIAWEAWAQQMAQRAGLRATAWRLEHVGTQPVLLEERFDRTEQGRVPYLSGLCALGLRDGDESDYAELADLVRTISSNPAEDLYELFGRMVFSVAIHNTDDHLRNHGLLRDRSGWRLSPLFDVNPNPHGAEQRALPLFGETGSNEVRGLKELARLFAIDDELLAACVRRVCKALRFWKTAAKRLGCSVSEIAMFEPVIEGRLEALCSTW